MTCLLQGLAKNHVVKGLVWIIGETLIDVALIHGHPTGDRALDFRAYDLDTSSIHVLVLLKPLQQLTFAAADIEHARVGLHQLADDGVIAASKDTVDEWSGASLHRSGFHGLARSRNVLARKPRTSSVCSPTSTRNASWP